MMADDKVEIASLEKMLLDATENEGGVSFADFRHEDADSLAASIAQGAGGDVRAVVEAIGGGEDAVLGALGDGVGGRGSAEDAGDGGYREAEVLTKRFQARGGRCGTRGTGSDSCVPGERDLGTLGVCHGIQREQLGIVLDTCLMRRAVSSRGKRLPGVIGTCLHRFSFGGRMTNTRLHRFRRIGLRLAFAAAGLALFSVPALAQFRASIQGTVADPEGGVIPGATLTLTDVDTNRVMTTTSNDSGVYNFNALPPDHFTLSASAKGFQQKVINNVTIIPEQANALNVQLVIGDVTTTVNVSGDTLPALDTETANLQGTVTSNDIQHLPSAGRSAHQ